MLPNNNKYLSVDKYFHLILIIHTSSDIKRKLTIKYLNIFLTINWKIKYNFKTYSIRSNQFSLLKTYLPVFKIHYIKYLLYQQPSWKFSTMVSRVLLHGTFWPHNRKWWKPTAYQCLHIFTMTNEDNDMAACFFRRIRKNQELFSR